MKSFLQRLEDVLINNHTFGRVDVQEQASIVSKREWSSMGSRPLCAGGGMWTMTFPKSKSDKYWAYMISLIMEMRYARQSLCEAKFPLRYEDLDYQCQLHSRQQE
ncbi:uncharacterized protein LOC110894691 [Helianthus annuus]|uniref:uncharacterized protein LOC110894691 n=1 Tax=Helianthus annuus TaxID=4232 RepID=UPI000B8F7172|nr:uncharacterized protein LOC110894691 [Helianthus annuus]